MITNSQQSEQCLGYEQISALSAAKGFTASFLIGCTRIEVIPQTQAVRWRSDGTNASATVGNPIAVGVMKEFTTTDLARVTFFEQAASAVLNVAYYGLRPGYTLP